MLYVLLFFNKRLNRSIRHPDFYDTNDISC